MPVEPLTAHYIRHPAEAQIVHDQHEPDDAGRKCIECSGVRMVPFPCALRHHADEALRYLGKLPKKRTKSP